MSGRLFAGAFGAIVAAGMVTAVAWIAYRHRAPPARCADGLVALGPRCCGEGQRLEAGRCTGIPTRCAPRMRPTPKGCIAEQSRIHVAGGKLHLSADDWEGPSTRYAVSEGVGAFDIDRHEVTEADYAECVQAGACPAAPSNGEPGLPQVRVSLRHAHQYCRWRGGDLPTAEELAFAAAGPTGRRYPWGETGLVCRRAAYGLAQGPCAMGGSGPDLAGSHPAGATAEGIDDLVGNVAEWTMPIGSRSAVRGGSYADASPSALRSSSERLVPVLVDDPAIGWRCVYAPRAR